MAAVGGAGPTGPCVIVVSASGAGQGKTLWIEALTRALVRRGRRVAVLKHHGHDAGGRDDFAKDTGRAARAGASMQLLLAPAAVRMYMEPHDAAALLALGIRLVQAAEGVDVVLAEGFRDIPARARLWVGTGGPAVADGLCLHVPSAASADPDAVARALDALMDA